ncbi:MAG: UvrD-helicase domain-containing protein [Nocardioides sp.]|uniref:UvrD-helicase domain-containing protein n=1 Tax=Nocardioides sp. TaxID=35761 RepID=UPI0039E5FE60
MDRFNLADPLPSGTTLLEASAGTGKTFTVAGLVTRYVAEGHARLEEMLVMTFGRAASQELRERVREQLVEAERALSRPVAEPPNELVALLVDADESELVERRRRLREALASFDAATIATTHQFCQLVLRSLGVAGDTDPGVRLVENLDDLVVEVVDDLYLQRYGQASGKPPFDRAAALQLAFRAVEDPQARLADVRAVEGSSPWERVDFAEAVRAEIERRKRRLGILSYDDLLGRLAAALEAPDAPARQRMRARWRIVLVDEFQDTDPVQWQVIDRAFSGHATVVLIGDPKQAIYGFRGGDVVTYLTAARTATTSATLATNWRTDQAVVDRLQVVLCDAALGEESIVVREVTAAHEGSRLAGLPHPSPFRIRALRRDGFRLTKPGEVGVRDARRHIAADCAADIAAALASGATYAGRPLQARDIAVLVGVREHGVLVQAELAARGIPSVVAGGGHVLRTPAADDWLALLEALDQPHRAPRVRAAALTAFFGSTTAELVEEDGALTDRVADTLRGWAVLLRGRGVAALVEAAEERGLTPRVLARTDGDRLLTDLRHIAQLLHETATRERLGLTALLQWFRGERERNAPTTERTRRLDSDSAAVQIVTIHASKGLQYPLVYLPFAYEKFVRPVETALFHEDGQRTLDVAGAGDQWAGHVALHQAEEAGEDLRELYVALTRAQSQVTCWWAPTTNTPTGPLHRLLFGRQPGQAIVPDRQALRDDDYSFRVLEMIEELGGPSLEESVVADAVPALPPADLGELARRRFERSIDTEWRRTSYSGLIRAEETSPAVDSEPEVSPLEDEPEDADDEPQLPVEVAAEATVDLPSPMADLPAGAAFGSLVHAVLEKADPQAADLRAELASVIAEERRWWPVDTGVEELADGLLPLHETPLGPLLPGLTLRDLGRADRLCELDFEFPLVGGDQRGAVPDRRLRDLAEVWRRHLPAGDPLLPYAHRLEQPVLGDQQLHGYLSGSIDVVLRATGPDGPRFVVVDYKTNLLGEPGRPATAADYARPRLAEAMLHSHYPLQATLYSVVLHRYLRWRLPAYDPDRHLGGVLYLYLRGMCGPDTPLVDGHPAGAFSWAPPTSFVLAVSDLLAGDQVPGVGVSG